MHTGKEETRVPYAKIPVNPDPTDVSMPNLETKRYKVNFQMSVKF